jgi:hypothetical protein
MSRAGLLGLGMCRDGCILLLLDLRLSLCVVLFYCALIAFAVAVIAQLVNERGTHDCQAAFHILIKWTSVLTLSYCFSFITIHTLHTTLHRHRNRRLR